MLELTEKIGRNDTCPCGSGLKYEKCCMKKDKLEKSSIKGENQTLKVKNSIGISSSNSINSGNTRFFRSKEDIFSSIRSEGFIPHVEYEETFEIDGEFSTVMEVELVCSHGHAEHSRTYDQLDDGSWEHVGDSFGFPCPDCMT